MGKEKAVVLLSGGLDPATVLAVALDLGYEVLPITIDYGQRHIWEIKSSKKIIKYFRIDNHKIIAFDLSVIGGSALTDDFEVPKNRYSKDLSSEIPITYVPARNLIFLSIALGYAEVQKASDIFLGVNAVDYSGYPDCRPEFINSFQQTANFATKMGSEGKKDIKIHTPLIDLNKCEIIKKGISLGVDYSITHSCYDPNSVGKSCSQCDACVLRIKGFIEAGLEDPLPYQNEL